MSYYDKEIIDNVLNKFVLNRMTDNKPITILFDADNTLFKFSTYGLSDLSLKEMYTKGFYKNLPVFSEAPTVIENLQRLGIKCGIASSVIDSPFCKSEKLQSFNYHFPMIKDEDIYLVETGVSKASLFEDVSDIILVDDFNGNIMDWYKAGGVAIKKSYSGKPRPVPQVMSLIDLFPLLHQLGVY